MALCNMNGALQFVGNGKGLGRMECLRLCVVACPRLPCRAPLIVLAGEAAARTTSVPTTPIVTFSTIHIHLMRSPESIVLCHDSWSCCPTSQRQGDDAQKFRICPLSNGLRDRPIPPFPITPSDCFCFDAYGSISLFHHLLFIEWPEVESRRPPSHPAAAAKNQAPSCGSRPSVASQPTTSTHQRPPANDHGICTYSRST